jgi:hypothetical protein
MKRVIQWESQHLEIDTTSGNIVDPEEKEEEFEYGYFDNSDNYIGEKLKTQNVISTPFGLWRVNDSMNPYKQFKLWLANTNFSITWPIVNIIKVIPGVEVLKVIGRYKFLLGVGQLFDIRDVRVAIERQLSCHREEESLINDEGIKQQVCDLKKQLSQYKNYAIYVFPNGKIDFCTSNEKDYGKKLGLYKQAVDFSSGVLIEGGE